ncbi:MAG: exodeoxyribonuclease VII large subunit [bacterium]|nr:exodeoxyribonuclease VII large subunit [bacterium]
MDKKVFTVSEYLELLNIYLRAEEVSIVGEIVELKPGARWVGFTLKDKEDGSLLKCVLAAWDFKRVGVAIDVGMEIAVTGSPSVSKKYGSFGFWVKHIEPVGEGALRKSYEILLKKLRADGLFDRKRPLPEFIQHIGVVSSREGVVIYDFKNNLSRLGLKITFVDARVEGDDAPSHIVAGIHTLLKRKPDIIVVIRGGGSLESMQAFNNERVCRAIYESDIPVAVGIGHDVDVPIACLVADVSSSTPTAVAHVVNQSWQELTDGLPRFSRLLIAREETLLSRALKELTRVDRMLLEVFHSLFTAVRTYAESLKRSAEGLRHRIQDVRARVARSGQILQLSPTIIMRTIRERITAAERLLEMASPLRNLSRGYSIVFNSEGRVVRDVSQLSIGDVVTTRLGEGSIDSTIKELK